MHCTYHHWIGNRVCPCQSGTVWTTRFWNAVIVPVTITTSICATGLPVATLPPPPLPPPPSLPHPPCTCRYNWTTPNDGSECATMQFGCPFVPCDFDVAPWCIFETSPCLGEYEEGSGWGYCNEMPSAVQRQGTSALNANETHPIRLTVTPDAEQIYVSISESSWYPVNRTSYGTFLASGFVRCILSDCAPVNGATQYTQMRVRLFGSLERERPSHSHYGD